MRLDVYLYQKDYVKSRQKAKVLIEEGNVRINGLVVSKPSYDIVDGCKVEITETCPYVSRGGLKLEKVLKLTEIDVSDKICLDIGASTGGFTHCLLLNGAKKVYAVDSGSNQLADVLKCDKRVVFKENFNARYISLDDIGETVDIVTMDVSFISQSLIIPNIANLMKESGVFISLIKPQFEVGRACIGKGGIVKDKKARLRAVFSVLECANMYGLTCKFFSNSPICGGDGNVEFLAAFCKDGIAINEEKIKKIVLE